MLTTFIVVLVIAVVAVIGFVLFGSRQPAPVVSRPDDELADGVVSDPVPIASSVPDSHEHPRLDDVTVSADAQIRWTKQFDPKSGALSDDARLQLINDLGMLRAAWCVPLLAHAYEEETEPEHRAAAHSALERCRSGVPPRRYGS